MSVPTAAFTLNAKSGPYQFTISSCNPAQPVSFQIGDQPYDPNRLSAGGYLGFHSGPLQITIITSPHVPVVTTPDQNPIKLTIASISNGEGSFTGSTAVFYGYYTRPYAGGLGFFLDAAQSMNQGQYGSSGIPNSIQQNPLEIILG